jgi:Ca-activated chloride channel family protein
LARAQRESERPTFSADVNLVNLLVTVQDESGAPLGDLKAGEFSVVDSGREREIAVFEQRTNRPLSVALLLDTSLSTGKELRYERESAKVFLERLLGEGSHPEDRAAIIEFSSYVDLTQGFTRNQRRLERALDSIRAEGGTSMYDAIYLAAMQLERRSGRHVMIVITDGGDTTSETSFQKALEEAQAVDAVIYGIIVVPIRSDAGRNTGGENALKTLAASTGGKTFIQYADEGRGEAFEEILRSLRTQYLIGYYPPTDVESTEKFRRISVRVRRPGVRVLARNGYFVPEPKKIVRPARPSIGPDPRTRQKPETDETTTPTEQSARQQGKPIPAAPQAEGQAVQEVPGSAQGPQAGTPPAPEPGRPGPGR